MTEPPAGRTPTRHDAPRRARHGPARLLWAAMALLAAVTALGMTGLAWLLIAYPKTPGPGPRGDVTLVPPATLGPDGLAEKLAETGTIGHPEAFRWLMRLLNAAPHLRRTHTVVPRGKSIDEIWPLLFTDRGQPVLRMTFPEGIDRRAFAAKLQQFGITERGAFVQAIESPEALRHWQIPADSAEGYLAPDTYEMRVGTPANDVAGRLVTTFLRRLRAEVNEHQVQFDVLHDQIGLDLHGLVTLASVVEKEAQQARERSIIAGVFLNRLRDPSFRPHRLQADPTVAYGCTEHPRLAPSCQQFDGRRVTPAMVRDPQNPYNTYRHDGLPPGPICNPGIDSIRAVLRNERHDYYYFVANGDGSHTFSHSLDEHNRAIQRGRDGR